MESSPVIPQFLTKEEVEEELLSIPITKPSYCSGYIIPYGSSFGILNPEDWVQIDPLRKRPITWLCSHQVVNGEPLCQPWAPIAYLLLDAYAKKEITKEQWRELFPRRYSPQFDGCPLFAAFDPNHPACVGYNWTPGPNVPKKFIPNTIRIGWEVDPLTKYMTTTPCNHIACDPSIAWKFALYHATIQILALALFGF